MTNSRIMSFKKISIIALAVLIIQPFFSIVQADTIPATATTESSWLCVSQSNAYTQAGAGPTSGSTYVGSVASMDIYQAAQACADAIAAPSFQYGGDTYTLQNGGEIAGGSTTPTLKYNYSNKYPWVTLGYMQQDAQYTIYTCENPEYPNLISGNLCENDAPEPTCLDPINFPIESGNGNFNKICIPDSLNPGSYCAFQLTEYQPNDNYTRFINEPSSCDCLTDICTDTAYANDQTANDPTNGNDYTETPEPDEPPVNPDDPNPTDKTDVGRLMPLLQAIDDNTDTLESLGQINNDQLNDIKNKLLDSNSNLNAIRNSATSSSASLKDIKQLLANSSGGSSIQTDPTNDQFTCPDGHLGTADGQCLAPASLTAPSEFGDYKLTELAEKTTIAEQELKDAFTDIGDSLSDMFVITFPSGGYIDDVQTIFGQDVDFGIGRIMQHFDLGALFPTIASIMAFFIIFGRK
ncbi:MAG: hypothetical protein GY941_08770 [Planctomycetes bacterium]|nr:hypothetical protein [Planctomycetota bacterium]